MPNREMIKAAIDNVPTACLDGLYQIVTAMRSLPTPASQTQEDWQAFIEKTYGCMADAPIERSEQGRFELRESWS